MERLAKEPNFVSQSYGLYARLKEHKVLLML